MLVVWLKTAFSSVRHLVCKRSHGGIGQADSDPLAGGGGITTPGPLFRKGVCQHDERFQNVGHSASHWSQNSPFEHSRFENRRIGGQSICKQRRGLNLG